MFYNGIHKWLHDERVLSGLSDDLGTLFLKRDLKMGAKCNLKQESPKGQKDSNDLPILFQKRPNTAQQMLHWF